ncbi:MAG: DUF6596 domain-containing protein [Acidobacteriota bacterium]
MSVEGGVHGLVDHLFRREAGRLVAALARSFGPAHLDLAEEVVQEAMLKALRVWPFHGVPERPAAWLYRVARNLALDRLRRGGTFRGKEGEIRRRLESRLGGSAAEARFSGEITDDQLRLMFLCCHPVLSQGGRVALTLKAVVGFGVPEIARALLSGETAVAQRVARAKRKVRERGLTLDLPAAEALPARLDAVAEVLYLMFNEGYGAHAGENLVRADLCAEARRLVEQLAISPAVAGPELHALAALFAFQASRLPARVGADGELRRLAEQDRSLWDRSLLRRAFAHLERAAAGERMSGYHLQAAIAAQHAAAQSVETTDWRGILGLYDRLLALQPSPVVALNRAVALARVEGPGAGLAALDAIADHPAVAGYYLLPATRGDLLFDSGNLDGARRAFQEALALGCSDPERRFLERRLAEL